MILRLFVDDEIALTPGSGPRQALAFCPFDKAEDRRWNGRGNFPFLRAPDVVLFFTLVRLWLREGWGFEATNHVLGQRRRPHEEKKIRITNSSWPRELRGEQKIKGIATKANV